MAFSPTNWQRRQNQNNNFSAIVPYDMELQRKESKEFLADLTTRDQRMMQAVLTLVITADSKQGRLIEQVGLVAHDKVVGNGVLSEVDAAPVSKPISQTGSAARIRTTTSPPSFPTTWSCSARRARSSWPTGEDVNGQHHIAVQVGQVGHDLVLDIVGVVLQEQHPAIAVAHGVAAQGEQGVPGRPHHPRPADDAGCPHPCHHRQD